MTFYDNFEQFDCSLFHESISKKETSFVEDLFESSSQPGLIPSYSQARYQKEAFAAWTNFYNPEEGSRQEVTNYINGTLSCFCDDHYKKSGLLSAFDYYRADGSELSDDNADDEVKSE